MSQTLDSKIRFRRDVARAHSDATIGRASTLMVKEGPVYDGRAREIFPIVLVNLILTFLTLGIYRFWAKTRLRRYFLSRIAFLGDRLEYTGTGKELFLGFLIVLAVLVPLSIVYELVAQFVMSQNPTALAFVWVGYALIFYYLYHFAVYRAQRYRLSRINWRGIRGGQKGSALLYAAQAFGWSVIVVATAGLAYPLMRVNLVRYKIDNACFGDETFAFDGGFMRLFMAWLIPWLGILAVIVPFALLAMTASDLNLTDGTKTVPPEIVAAYKSLAPYIGLGVIVFVLALFWYRAAEVRYFASHTRFDALRFGSELRGIQVFWPYALYWLILVLMFAAFWAAAVGLGAMAILGGVSESSKVAGMVGGVFVVLAVLVIGGILQPLIVQNLLIRAFCKKLTIQGSFSPDRLFQNQLAIPQRGEGLADALDVDAF
ncbi:MAG: DUF898 domain-containing protein [Alphaproteobacteria bacterium]|nr:DUF898 domain-containing protein [Alphaproteobacteria bacterium]